MVEAYSGFLNVFVDVVEIVLNTIAIYTVLKSVVIGIKKQVKKEGSAKHTICKGISNALNYNLATEVMKIIVGREGEDLLIIGALLILKAMITTLFMLEIKQDEMQEKHIENLRKAKKK